MRKYCKWFFAFVLCGFILYVVSYLLFVKTDHPALDEMGKPIYRSSYPRLSSVTEWNRDFSWYFPKAGAANLFFLPIDNCWRTLKGLPPSKIQDENTYWHEYFEYLVEIGILQKAKRKPNTASKAIGAEAAPLPER